MWLIPPAAHAKRIALLIGNADYKSSPLRNPVNDVRAIETKLRALGFDIFKRENIKRSDVGRLTRDFLDRLKEGDEVVFFYAGHGVQYKDINYLPAVDADIETEDDIPLNSINVKQLLERIEEARPNMMMIFLDACRNNPFSRSFRSLDRGLARMGYAPPGTLVSFATRPGAVASDGDGKNGTYTTHLLRYMDEPGLPIEQLLKRVAAGVSAETRGRQEPWVEGGIRGDFTFAMALERAAAASPQGEARLLPSIDERERAVWDSLKTATSVEPLKEYLRLFPSGTFKAEASVLIAKLTADGGVRNREDEEGRAWSQAESQRTADLYEVYLASYPQGRFVKIAKSRLNDLLQTKELVVWAAGRDGSLAKVRDYLELYPTGRFVNEAKDRLRKFTEEAELQEEVAVWSTASTRSGLNTYIAKYPHGRFLEDARKRTLVLEAQEMERSRPPPSQPIVPVRIIPPAM